MRETLIAMIILAHSWYPLNCCSEADCHQVDCELFAKMVSTGEIADDKVRPSQDEWCHVCRPTAEANVRCAFRPVPST